MKYLATLGAQAVANAKTLAQVCKTRGITNPVSIAGVLAVISKESGFIPKYETGYSNTSVARIRSIFSTTLKDYTDEEINQLKQDDRAFFNAIYGGRFGNDQPDAGYMYRGGGLNQITFYDNYKRMSELTGFDLIANPDQINQINVASACVAEYFKDRFIRSAPVVKKRYGASHINDFKDLKLSAQAFYNANAGFQKDTRNSKMDGYKRALDRVNELYSLIHF